MTLNSYLDLANGRYVERGRMAKRGPSRSERKETKHLLTSWLAERPDLDLTDFLLGIVIQRSGRMLETSFDRMCRSNFGISGQDMRVLFALRRNGASNGMRPTDLFRALLVTSGAITKQVDRLQSKGLVARVADNGDGSSFKVFLTKSGVKVANAATERQSSESLLKSALVSFSVEDRKAGAAFAYRLLDALENELYKEIQAKKQDQIMREDTAA